MSLDLVYFLIPTNDILWKIKRNHFCSYHKITELFFKHVNEFSLVLASAFISGFSSVEIARVARLLQDGYTELDVFIFVRKMTLPSGKHSLVIFFLFFLLTTTTILRNCRMSVLRYVMCSRGREVVWI